LLSKGQDSIYPGKTAGGHDLPQGLLPKALYESSPAWQLMQGLIGRDKATKSNTQVRPRRPLLGVHKTGSLGHGQFGPFRRGDQASPGDDECGRRWCARWGLLQFRPTVSEAALRD